MNIDEALAKATDTKSCLIGDGVLARVPAVFKEQFPGKTAAIVIADPRTWAAAGEKVAALLEAAGVRTAKFIVEPSGKVFHAEYHYVDDVRAAIAQSPNRTIEQSNNRTVPHSNNRTIEQSNNSSLLVFDSFRAAEG